MASSVREIIRIFETKASPQLAMEWDAVGLQVGAMDQKVSRIFITLDLTPETLEEAIEKKADLIITHHPFIFHPLKTLRTDDLKGKMIARLIQNEISLYAAHTNVDIATGGLNDWAATLMTLKPISILEETSSESLEKLVVFIPVSYASEVAQAIMEAGAGHIGEYSHCGYYLNGKGTFKPLEKSNPFIGDINKLEEVEEVRLETIMPESIRNHVLQQMIQAHPYEEVAYDVYPLKNKGHQNGIGRVGELPTSMIPDEFIKHLKKVFSLSYVRWTPGRSREINRVAVLTGSGASAIDAAVLKGCDCLVTGDIKYHDAQSAYEKGIHLFDIGHFESEITFVPLLIKQLQAQLNQTSIRVDIIGASTQVNPIHIR